ncbi:B3/B4 domain-containing protein [Kordiimonas aquimaris]|uniref:B3/B4 domain-containing protein n=1 Tax=Kordiimonas aquimaris TaxID=707591 RepID=UPI0021CEB1FD|nr:phenylalanine--tRNA ligase beta subunit-related protein [Kordiimonas aquimaris]
MQFDISPEFKTLGFPLHLGVLDYKTAVGPTTDTLQNTITEATDLRQQELLGEAASSDPVIAAVRAAFKAIGKDPSRYRPSSEALTRRIVAGKGLYLVNNVVDCGNLVSLMTGLPVGCYDAAWIKGSLKLRIGTPGETYDGIGRGSINLEGLAVLSDEDGPFGSPFSDSARTAVTDKTKDIIFVIYGFNVDVAHVEAAAEIADALITKYCSA